MQTMISLKNRPAWVDLATSDAEAARKFYSQLFGWDMEVSEDPQYGGYATAKVPGGGAESSAAGIGPKQDPNMPNVWSLYIGSDDLDALADEVNAGRWHRRRGTVRRWRPGPHGGLPGPVGRVHLRLAGRGR